MLWGGCLSGRQAWNLWGQSGWRSSAIRFETVGIGLIQRLPGRLPRLVDDDLARLVEGKLDTVTGKQLQGVADLLGDGDLALDGQGCCHGCAPKVLLIGDGIAVDPLGQGVYRTEGNRNSLKPYSFLLSSGS